MGSKLLLDRLVLRRDRRGVTATDGRSETRSLQVQHTRERRTAPLAAETLNLAKGVLV